MLTGSVSRRSMTRPRRIPAAIPPAAIRPGKNRGLRTAAGIPPGVVFGNAVSALSTADEGGTPPGDLVAAAHHTRTDPQGGPLGAAACASRSAGNIKRPGSDGATTGPNISILQGCFPVGLNTV